MSHSTPTVLPAAPSCPQRWTITACPCGPAHQCWRTAKHHTHLCTCGTFTCSASGGATATALAQ